ncbi:MAG TPA: lipopolysaccharide biosynthesis protein [Acidimicrobiia bacterium]|jgi:O-antigen/teichoic acid export membrane protein
MTVDAPAPLARMRSDRVDRVVAHLREPLQRNSYALVANTLTTSVLGLAYWTIAAREYGADTATVGRNTALISMMMFLTNLASLNFTDVLNRFVPVAGSRARRLVETSYLIAVSLGGVAATTFVLGRKWWTPWLDTTLHGAWLDALFVVAVMMWVVFVLQDAVLIGLRETIFVFFENTTFGVVKIALLLVFATLARASGIFLSWTVPLIAIVLVVNSTIFRKFLPRYSREFRGEPEPFDRRIIGRFIGADYVASVAGTTATSLMPLIVLAMLGASASAYVFFAWTISYTLYLISRNVGMALTTEGASDPENLDRYTRAALTTSARIVVPLSVAVAIGARWLPLVFGKKYAANSVGLLALFALSAIPAIVPTTVASVARVQRRLKTLVLVSVLSTLPALALIPLFTHWIGIAGSGLAWLVVQSVAAIVLLTGELAHIWRRPRRARLSPTAGLLFAPAQQLAAVSRNGNGNGNETSSDAAYYVRLEAAPQPQAASGAAEERGTSEIGAERAGERSERPDAPRGASTASGGTGAERAGERSERPDAPRDARRKPSGGGVWPASTLGAGLVLWLLTLAWVHTTTLGSYGLVSNLPVVYFAGIAVVAASFVVALVRGARPWLLAAHGVLLLLMLHATPSITYAELRYAWAWKHVGVIDMLQHGHVLTGGTAVLDIYQHWAGFFAAATTLVSVSGVKSAVSFAGWGPPFFAILDAALLAVALRGLTDDRRRIALAVWIFMIGNWVGQEYFSPQAFGFALYLAIMAIVLRWYQRPPALTERFRARTLAPVEAEVAPTRGVAPQRRAVAVILIVLMVATTTSHPLTPIVACFSLGALLAFRALDRRWPLVAMVSITVLWLVTGAWSFTYSNISSLVSQFGRLDSNVNSNLASFGNLSPAQHVVADMGRLVVALVALLALAGFARRVRHGYVDRAALALCVAPALLLAAGAYGGEAILRSYLFTLPFAAFLAAGLFFPSKEAHRSWANTLAIGAITCALIVGTLFAYYGKDAWSDFTPGEVRAASIVFSSAPPHSLLIDGTLEYPTQFENVNNITYVTIGTEPPGSVKQVLADPVNVLSSWMSDPRYSQGYLIITKSQIAEIDATGQLPRGSLQRIERLLVASPKIKVLYHDRDALLVTVARPASPAKAAAAKGSR